MNPVRIDGALPQPIGAPPNWSEETHGHCGALFVRLAEGQGGLQFMQSAWEPTPAELAALNAGAKVVIGISAPVHPVVHVTVGDTPD